jgi:hypothetical protein
MKVFVGVLLVILLNMAAPLRAEVDPSRQAHAYDNVEVHAVQVDQGSIRTGQTIHGPEVYVSVDRPQTRVILLLGADESLRWKIVVAEHTEVSAIILNGREAEASEVWINGHKRTDVTLSDLPSAYVFRGGDFQQFIKGALRLTGGSALDSFSGAYAANEAPFVVDSQSPKLPDPSPDYLAAQLLDHSKVPRALRPVIGQLGLQAVLPSNVQFTDDGFVLNSDIGSSPYTYQVTLDVPTISHPVAAARDQRTGKFFGVSLGGEGFLYSFDPAVGVWAVETSMNEEDATGIIHDADNERMIIVITELLSRAGPALLIYGANGATRQINLDREAFVGLADMYSLGGGFTLRLLPIAIAENKLLVAADRSAAYRAYLIDMSTGAVSLVAYSDRTSLLPMRF